MSKIALVCTVALISAFLQQSAALKCYSCTSACEVSKATTTECGKNITPATQDVVCTTETAKGGDQKVAIRRCAIVNKGQPPTCAPNLDCKSCMGDLCNGAPPAAPTPKPKNVATSVATSGTIVAAVVITSLML